ncbi:zinc finger protein Eos-like [Octopus vulgaris]|uniref:Zinc finger protein Eos-like n=2 Tax=Octopus TaxID=6643 RepID=A0AA36F930_OCTVU|nr:zinc finger protein 836 [Octopus sinensis]CAI9729050.1 zinc finger protein Eos-like [Octopus vulgaris]
MNTASKIAPTSSKYTVQVVTKYMCRNCGQQFESTDDMDAHIETHNRGNPPHSCFVCGKSYRTPSKLRRHVRVHSGERPYACSLCERRFTRSDHVKQHMKVHQPQRQRNQCRLCGLRFSKPATLYTHLQGHGIETLHMCDLCGETFREEDHLARHKRVHHGGGGGNGGVGGGGGGGVGNINSNSNNSNNNSQDTMHQNAVSTTTLVSDDIEQEFKMDHNNDENVNALSIACFGMSATGSNRLTPVRILPDESRPASNEQPPHCMIRLDNPDRFLDQRMCDDYENNALNLSTKPDVNTTLSSCYTPTESTPVTNHNLTYIKTEPINNGVGMYMTPNYSGEERNDDLGERGEENSSLSEERFTASSPLMQTPYAHTLQTTTTTTTTTNGGTIASLLQQHTDSIPPSFSLQRNSPHSSESYPQPFPGKRYHHCMSCGIWFEDLAMSMLHNSLHYTDGLNEFSCKKCSKKLSNRLEFTAHLVWHLEPNTQ